MSISPLMLTMAGLDSDPKHYGVYLVQGLEATQKATLFIIGNKEFTVSQFLCMFQQIILRYRVFLINMHILAFTMYKEV